MLTAGRYLATLADGIRKRVPQQSATIESVTDVAACVLKQEWKKLPASPRATPNSGDILVFVFVAGFDQRGRPRLFYLDSRSTPRFLVQERRLFETGQNVEIGALSHDRGRTENPANTIVKHFNALQARGPKPDVGRLLYAAFNATKDELSTRNRSIGGNTYAALIDRVNGYRDVTGIYRR